VALNFAIVPLFDAKEAPFWEKSALDMTDDDSLFFKNLWATI
jgi:hypothetical protein